MLPFAWPAEQKEVKPFFGILLHFLKCAKLHLRILPCCSVTDVRSIVWTKHSRAELLKAVLTSIYLQEIKWDQIDIFVVLQSSRSSTNHIWAYDLNLSVRKFTQRNVTAISISSLLIPLYLPCLCPQMSFSPLITQCVWRGTEWRHCCTHPLTHTHKKNLFEENKCFLPPFLKFV